MFDYDPATVSPCELPIYDRVSYCSKVGGRFWGVRSAKEYCVALRSLPDPSQVDLTAEEWEAVAIVADGGTWPVPDRPYTRENWHADRSFNAVPGQEITEEIYEEMFEVMPPYRLPRCKRTEGCASGFLMSEPTTDDPRTGKNLYSAFGKRGGSYYFIGLLPCRPGE